MSSYGSDVVSLDSDADAIIIDRDDVSNYNPDQILPEPPETIAKIRAWLQSTSYDVVGGEYRKHLVSHVAGTGTWLTASDAYQKWLRSDEHGLFWIKGIPGSGKSVMAANLIQELGQSKPGCPVLFFFFRQIIDANHEPEALLRDWMDQVLEYSPPLQKQLKTYMDERRAIKSLSIEDFMKNLRMAFLGLPGKVFCVADALDEMDQGHDVFLQALGSLGQWEPGKVKVLITSRPVPRVEVPMRKIPGLCIRLEEDLVDMDISTYVQVALSRSTIPQDQWQVIANAVPGRANGLFLYAKLAMDAFLEPGANVNEVLSHLPADLNVLYTDLLGEHARRSGVPSQLQHLILQSVTHAARPFRLLELAEMIRTITPKDLVQDLKKTKDLIRAACGPLLEILADETVSVVHHSFTEYLKGTTRSNDDSGYPILRMGPTHAQLAEACLTYLQNGCLDTIQLQNASDKDHKAFDSPSFSESRLDWYDKFDEQIQLKLKHPFFGYAADYWNYHVTKSEEAGHDQTDLNRKIQSFLGEDARMKAWLQIKWPGPIIMTTNVTQLHIAAKAGLISYTQKLLQHMDVDGCDIAGKTPLWWAATDGRSAVIRELVAAGADPDHDNKKYGLKPLHEAASKNHHEAVTVLLQSGVDPLTKKTKENPGRFCGNASRSTGHTPLMYACQNGHLEAVEAFLPFLKDINTVHRALAWASEGGHSRVVARILQHPGVDVNATVRGQTALFRACGRGSIETIDLLLNAGADPCVECYNHGDEFAGMRVFYPFGPVRTYNALDQLCKTGYRMRHDNKPSPVALKRLFLTFVEAGIDINQRRTGGNPLLHDALGSPIMIRLLLDAGADANALNNSGSSALHVAGDPDVIALLVEHGQADINLKAMEDGRTPLLRSLESRSKNPTMKLLQYRPKCDVVDNNGDGALHISLSKFDSDPEVIKALLDAGADPNLRNNKGMTPLLSMRFKLANTESLIDLLLESGADIHAVDRNGATLLFRLMTISDSRRGQKLIQRLIDRGASLYVRDFQGRTCLHAAVRSYNEDRSARDSNDTKWGFEFMLGLGLNLQAVDYLGNGLLHELAIHPDTNHPSLGPKLIVVWKQLMSLGLGLERKNYTGRTPLHLMCNAMASSERSEPGHLMPIDYVISQTKNLDDSDNEGITPLHIAVTKGQLFTKKLLNAGADPMVCTKQGFTPLHIAACCGESNVVGLLLHALKVKARGETCLPSFYATALTQSYFLPWNETRSTSEAVPGLDAEASPPPPYAKSVITPLFYACQSGRPETVAILLEAGADVKKGRVFEACRGFEEENEAWQRQGQENTEELIFKSSATSNSTQSSIFTEPRRMRTDRTNRLEEILDLLIRFGADPDGLDISKWHRGVLDKLLQKKHDYVITCFQNAHDKIKAGGTLELKPKSALELNELLNYRLRKASVLTLRGSNFIQPGSEYLELFNQYLARREYHLVEELAYLRASFLPVAGAIGVCKLGILIKGGYASLLEKVVTIQAESTIAQGEWHAFGDDKKPGLWYAKKDVNKIDSRFSYHEPFLLVAVQRELSNMDVVRLLVEKFGTDVNELYHTQQCVDNEYKTVPSNSALHSVARGDSWWHVYEALPYLLKNQGIDLEIRNHLGQTPLHMALQADGKWPGPFHKNAAKILIEAGADVNAVNGKGENCLVCAQNHVDLIKILISHGATITTEAVLALIDTQNLEALKELLSGGFDPNLRPEKRSTESASNYLRDRSLRPVKYTLELHETYPLYHAATNILFSTEAANPQNRQKYENSIKIVQVLLDHGANPFAEFIFRKKCSGGEIYGPSRRRANPNSGDCDKRTILHDLFDLGKPIEHFLQIPSLDVNHRDPKGRTLLHAACESSPGPDLILGGKRDSDVQSKISVFMRLLHLGAELEARDNRQRNVLHCMIGDHKYPVAKSFTYALWAARGLANQPDIDGLTPLHYAAKSTGPNCYLREAKQLRSTGADVHARTKNGDSLLHLQAGSLRTKELRLSFRCLVERGLDINARNAQGETPLFRFCEQNKAIEQTVLSVGNRKMTIHFDKTIIQMFKKLGADFSTKDNAGRGLLHVVANGSVDFFQLLMDEGLDAMLEDDDQKTAIDVAAACGNHGVLELFEKKQI